MLRVIRIGLIALTVMLLIGAGILFYYNYTHEDISKPTFQASSATIEVSVKAERKDLCAGLHAYDNMDGDITDRIMVQSISSFSADDSFRVRYIVFDRASNYSVCERVARYTDYTPPTFTLNKPMVFNVGDTITYLDRISANDCIEGDISDRITLLESNVSSSTQGTYRIKVSVTNKMGDTAELPLTVLVRNASPSAPTITLSKYLLYQKAGELKNFRTLIASVSDPLLEEAAPKKNVKINSSGYDYQTPGTYDVYYYYTGASGETATAVLTVVVE